MVGIYAQRPTYAYSRMLLIRLVWFIVMLGLCGILFFGSASAESFEAWKANFREAALAAGISAATYDREMSSVTRVPRVMELNDNQPEFTRTIWQYLDSAVSERRVADGLHNKAAQAALLARTEVLYGVDVEILVAIWGLETSYGKIQGTYDTLSALSTLAYQGRRTKYGRTQLIGALKILDAGYAKRTQLKGSWAGAMGQTQFIPTTYLDYALDHNDDGRRDLWENLEDVFASTANYLSRAGYTANAPWGFEVTLPVPFQYELINKNIRKPIAKWSALGITKANGTLLHTNMDPNIPSYLIIPAGAQGPAFIVFDNFNAILRYNNSTAYALGIGLLADKIANRFTPLVKNWPRHDQSLNFEERKVLQQALADHGYQPGAVDGIIGIRTKKALKDWQRDNSLTADGYASREILSKLLQ